MAIKIWGNSILLGSNGIAAADACCCGGCSADWANLDTDDQPNVEVSDSTCDCDGGTHDGSYPYLGDDPIYGGVYWEGQTTCDYTGFPSSAAISIKIWCDEETDLWNYRVDTYEFEFESLYAEGTTDQLSVDGNGHLVGSFSITLLYAVDDSEQCTMTLTFG